MVIKGVHVLHSTFKPAAIILYKKPSLLVHMPQKVRANTAINYALPKGSGAAVGVMRGLPV